jgi:hypothetical protein
MKAEDKFACSACGLEFGHETSVNECRRCHRSYCEECIDTEGYCVPCEDTHK